MKQTNLSSVLGLTTVEGCARYDTNIKEILSDKQILARILQHTMKEFQDMDIPDIIKNMDTPVVSKERMEPGWSNYGKVEKGSSEDKVPNEGAVYYDIRFSIYHGETWIKYLINIEAQNSTLASRLGYDIDNRMILYMGRMVSSQLEVEIFDSQYDDLKPVRSIWICMDGKVKYDSINRIYLDQEVAFGQKLPFKNLYKVEIIVIQLRASENAKKSKNQLIAMLEELIRKDDFEHKKQVLSEEYGLVMELETERKVKEMCNWSTVLIEQGIQQGMEKGMEYEIFLNYTL